MRIFVTTIKLTRHDSDRLVEDKAYFQRSYPETCVISTRDKSPKRIYSNANLVLHEFQEILDRNG